MFYINTVTSDSGGAGTCSTLTVSVHCINVTVEVHWEMFYINTVDK